MTLDTGLSAACPASGHVRVSDMYSMVLSCLYNELVFASYLDTQMK